MSEANKRGLEEGIALEIKPYNVII